MAGAIAVGAGSLPYRRRLLPTAKRRHATIWGHRPIRRTLGRPAHRLPSVRQRWPPAARTHARVLGASARRMVAGWVSADDCLMATRRWPPDDLVVTSWLPPQLRLVAFYQVPIIKFVLRVFVHGMYIAVSVSTMCELGCHSDCLSGCPSKCDWIVRLPFRMHFEM